MNDFHKPLTGGWGKLTWFDAVMITVGVVSAVLLVVCIVNLTAAWQELPEETRSKFYGPGITVEVEFEE